MGTVVHSWSYLEKTRSYPAAYKSSLASTALLILSISCFGEFWVRGDFYKIKVLQSCWRGRNRSDNLYAWHITMRWGSSSPADNLSVGLIHTAFLVLFGKSSVRCPCLGLGTGQAFSTAPRGAWPLGECCPRVEKQLAHKQCHSYQAVVYHLFCTSCVGDPAFLQAWGSKLF